MFRISNDLVAVNIVYYDVEITVTNEFHNLEKLFIDNIYLVRKCLARLLGQI